MERFFGQFRPEQFAAAPKEFVSFKAGRCDIEDKGNSKFMVTPDRRKGLLILCKAQDELTHLQWKDRTSNTVVEDTILMPDTATFSKVDTGNPKDRVFLLQYTGSSRRMFYWMQSASDEKDAENCRKLNDYMNNPQLQEQEGGAAPSQPQDVQDLLSSMLGGAPGGGATAAAPAAPSTTGARPQAPRAPGQLTQADFQRALQNLAGLQAQQHQPVVPLTEVVNADEVLRSGVLRDPAVQEQLIPLLAEGQQTPEELEAIMRSPQLRSTLASLTGALQTENFNSILSNFGLDPTRGAEALARGNNVDAFLAALLALQQDTPAPSSSASVASTSSSSEAKDGGKQEEEKK